METSAHNHLFITGGTGFIGSHLCRRLAGRGAEITVLSRRPDIAAARLPQGVRVVGAIQDLHQLPPVTGVINLAGEPLADRRWSQARKRLFYASRVELTEQLFEYFNDPARRAPGVLVSGSAIGYYGPQGDNLLTEDGESVPSYASDLCRAWESMACQFETLGTRVCRVRTGIVLGHGGALKAMLPAFRLGLGGPMGRGDQWMSWIHIDDMVAALDFCLVNHQLQGGVNATAPEPVTNRTFARTLARSLSRPGFLPMPAWVMRLLFGEMAEELLLSGQRVVPDKLTRLGFVFSYPRLQPALDAILANAGNHSPPPR